MSTNEIELSPLDIISWLSKSDQYYWSEAESTAACFYPSFQSSVYLLIFTILLTALNYHSIITPKEKLEINYKDSNLKYLSTFVSVLQLYENENDVYILTIVQTFISIEL